MKIAIYFEENTKQVIFTPENEYETSIVKQFEEDEIDLSIKFGSFYNCTGGWVREGLDKNSLMIILSRKHNAKTNN